jgi:tRNA A37 N6-isopentenylltransferase MiaA
MHTYEPRTFTIPELAGKLTKTEMRDQLATAIWHYARRQKTWFRRDKTITWFTRDEVAKIEKHIRAEL